MGLWKGLSYIKKRGEKNSVKKERKVSKKKKEVPSGNKQVKGSLGQGRPEKPGLEGEFGRSITRAGGKDAMKGGPFPFYKQKNHGSRRTWSKKRN